MIQVVLVSLIAVAVPYCASVLLPVAPVPDKYIVSDVIEIVALDEAMLTNVIAVPMVYATDAFAGIV